MTEEPRLTPVEIAYLNRLGEAICACPSPRERDQSIRFTLTVCRTYRARGVSATAIARALEITAETLFEWLLADTPKPGPSPSPQHPVARIEPQPDDNRSPVQPANINQSQSAVISMTDYALGVIDQVGDVAELRQVGRTLLAVSGDPRPGENVFGLEMAAIRAGLGMLPIDVRELSCPDLAELTTQLRRMPTILHIAAHNSSGGVALTFEGVDSSIEWDLFANAVLDVPIAPKLIVLNVCNSVPLGKQLAGRGTPVLSWPNRVSDEQARQMATLLYRQLGTGSTIGQSHREVCSTLSPRWPDLHQPLLHGTRDTRPL